MVEEAVIVGCTCGSIGRTDGIRFCEPCHRYWLDDRELVSVSKVLRTVYPIDYSGVDPVVLENARIRGVQVDKYFSTYLKIGTVTTEPNERNDVLDRLERLINWWEQRNWHAVDVQRIVYSLEDGIAGTFDFGTSDLILDLKNSFKIEPTYSLQIGAYSSYDGKREAGIVHVTKKDVRLVTYDAKKIREQWRKAADWFKTRMELEK